jgi:integrase
MIRADLSRAGIPYEDGQRRVVDFHALRMTFITNLSLAGVSPQAAQRLARHSDINLTMNTYTQLGVDSQAGAVESLPALPPPAKKNGEARGRNGRKSDRNGEK